MKKVIRINNTIKVEEIKNAAHRVINQIEKEWEENINAAKLNFNSLNFIAKIWHKYILDIFTDKNKFNALKDVELEYQWKYMLQYKTCKTVASKLEIVKSIDLSESDCKSLWLEDLWDKTTKISVD